MKQIFNYGQERLTASIALSIARNEIQGSLNAESRALVQKSAAAVQSIVESERIVYGINTGFGPLCTSLINKADTRLLQENILKSHAVGMGEPIAAELSKLMLILKAQALAQGFSGIQEQTLERILWHIDQDVIPVVPKQGSVGASGDLAPLSHLFLPLIGLGKVHYKGSIRATAEVLQILEVAPIHLSAKEGLALINGTQFIAAHGVLAVEKFHRVLMHADLVATVMLEGLNASIKPFYKELHELRPYAGNQFVAQSIFNLLKGSAVLESHANCARVQDPYSLRCIPQVHGASRTAWLHLKELVETELNAVTDNPIVIDEHLTISGGNFHGQPLAMVLDYACLAASEIGNISDRRVYLSLEGDTPNVPKLLLKSTGLNSGFMILQYTTAALASENKGLCFPSSADSIPTSLGQEDHVSMGSISGRKLLQVLENVEKILSVELICAAQALDFHLPLKPTPIIEAVHQAVRQQIPHVEDDQVMEDIISHALQFIQSGTLLDVARNTATEAKQDYITVHAEKFDTF